MKQDLLLIDANNMVHRAYHGFSHDPTNDDLLTNFKTMFNKTNKEFNPPYMATVFDHPEENFRHQLFSEYKATRERKEDMQTKMEPVRNWVGNYFPYFCIEGYEADDVIATLVLKAENHGGFNVTIVSSDKDLLQLVSDKTSVYNAQAKKLYKRNDVFDKFGVYPESMVDYLALLGDESDNIPGVSKCGPVGARQLIETFGTVENMVENASSVGAALKSNKSVIQKQFENNSDQILLSKNLVQLRSNVDLNLTLKDIKNRHYTNRHTNRP